MSTRSSLTILSTSITLLLAAAGCSHTPEVSQRASDAQRAATNGEVLRSHGARGEEHLSGMIVVNGEGGSIEIREDVTIDAQGHLERAELDMAYSDHSRPVRHIVVDRAAKRVVDGSSSWQVAGDEPWAYGAIDVGSGPKVATPVGAWVAYRAAQSGPYVRMVDVFARADHSVAREEIAVATEAGTTVVIGDASADVDGRFVRRMRLDGTSTWLVRTPESESRAVFVRVEGRDNAG